MTYHLTKCLLRATNLSTKFYTLTSIQSYSTDSSNNNVTPVKLYANADIQKLEIMKDNKGKSGIYRWTNPLNGKTYIGSAKDLNKRFRNYYSFSYLSRHNSSLIYKALLKYGYSNFSLEILEYCEVSDLITKEQFYLDSLQPEYNILKIAGSSLGYQHSEEFKQKFSELMRGENNPFFGKNHSQSSKDQISQTLGTIIYQYSLSSDNRPDQLLDTFPSSKFASKKFNTNTNTIMKYARSNNIFKDQYILSLVPLNFNFVATPPSSRKKLVYVYYLDYQPFKTFPSVFLASKFFQTYPSSIMKFARSGDIFLDKYILSLTQLPSTT